jgi:hypothetical protein
MKRLLMALLVAMSPSVALAIECPAGAASCKVLVLTPQEEQILVQPQGILPTAAEARKIDFGGAVQYFLQRIKDAPAGEVPKPAAAPSPGATPEPEKKP